jgi:RND superfamily putative drug exporter
VISLGLVIALLGDALTSEIRFTGMPESKRAEQLLVDRLHGEEQARETVIIRSGTLTVDDQAFRDLGRQLYDEIVALGSHVVDSAFSYFVTPLDLLVSDDRRTTVMPLIMTGSYDDALDNIGQVHDVIGRFRGDEAFQVLITGNASIGEDWMEAAQSDLETAEIFGIPIALVILVLVFGSLAAAMIPLVLGVIAIVIAVGMVAVIGQAYDFSTFVVNMVAAVGFALGIDYSLFIVSRYREERSRGREKLDAIEATAGTASRTVFFSGTVVVLALLGMLIVPVSIFQSIAAGAIMAVIAAVAATLTLLPAVLSLMGDRINSLRVPFVGHRLGVQGERSGGFWERTAHAVMRRPVITLALAAGLLIAAIVPVYDFNLGASGVSTLPDRLETKQGFLLLEEDFSYGLVNPARIVIDGDIGSGPVQAGIERLTGLIEADDSFYGTPELQVNDDGDLAELSAPLDGEPEDDQAINAVRRLRGDYIPQAFDGVDAEVLVGGNTAGNMDYIDITGDSLPVVIVFVLSLSFILLMVVFHSIVVPAKAILMNLLSVGATYGLVVLVFQMGVGSGLFGFQELDKFEAWVPIFLFCLLFGLSMDYHVFLLSRVRERYDQTGDNKESVAFGLRTTGSIITGAALIMVAVFAGFAAGDLVMFQQMGFGMAVAVILDATIVRSVLVPSAMQLLGTRNWYLPGFLRWLPRVRLRE